MTSSKEEIYDAVYGKKSIKYEAPRGLMAWLHSFLLKCEVNRHQIVMDLLPDCAERFLDIGCGDGDFIFKVEDRFSDCYGIDVSSIRVQKGDAKAIKHNDGKKFHFKACDVDNGLHLPDSLFDTITCISVLEHVFNPPKTIEEIYRILKPDGIFIVQVPNIAWLPLRLRLFFGKLPTTGGVYSGADWEHLHIFTKEVLCNLLREKGFSIKKIVSSGVFAHYRNWWISVLGSDIIIQCIKTKSQHRDNSKVNL